MYLGRYAKPHLKVKRLESLSSFYENNILVKKYLEYQK